MGFKPHDHRMGAIIGIYSGWEQNLFYRHSEHGPQQGGTQEFQTKDVIRLDATLIHAGTNPLDRITGAIRVYGDDFFATPPSAWHSQTFEEQPFDVADALRAFEKTNILLQVREKWTDGLSVRSGCKAIHLKEIRL